MSDFIGSVSDHLNPGFAPNMDVLVENAKKVLEAVDYDTIVGTGLSGALVIPVLARTFGKKFALVRKGEQSHGTPIEGYIGQRWIFVDDFVSSGATRRRVRHAINQAIANYNHDNRNISCSCPHCRKIAAKGEFQSIYVGTYSYYRNTWQPA